MATLDEVVAEMLGDDYIHDPIQFVIDSDLRVISIPRNGVIAGVVGDKNVNRVNFQMPRYYNGFDMSKFTTRVNYINALGNFNYYSVTDLTIEDDLIYFTWLVDSDVVAYAGIVMFAVNMFIADSNGKIIQSFNTSNKGLLNVLEGIQVNEYVTPEEQEDILTRLEADISKYVDSGITKIDENTNKSIQKIQTEKNRITESITSGINSISSLTTESIDVIQNEGINVKKSIPADYTELDKTVSGITDQIPGWNEAKEKVVSLKEDIGNQEDKLEPIVKSKQDLKDAFYIVDVYGNIICKVDKDGVHASGFDGKNLALNDVISTYEDSFYISDSNGNVIFKADKDGIRGLNMGASSGIDSPFKGMKLLTIGDSLSAHNNWQKWLVKWLGVTFDNNENINGKDGHKPMAKGGTAIAPTTEDSIYMRSLDAKYYADDTNGTVIIIYAGQNDSVALGTIDDTPYTDKTVTASSNLTFYSSYMGMIENILADIPFARIYLMTQMPVRLEIGMTGTAEPYIGVIRFSDMTSVLAYEANRYKKVEAIRAISKKYSLPCIDLWADSGINDYNSKYWYGAVGGTCGQVHPNNIGYKRMAEVAVAKMY